MTTLLTSAEIAATRHLLGLSGSELGRLIGVSDRTIRWWESGKYKITGEVAQRLLALKELHDQALIPLLAGAEDGVILNFPPKGTEEYPRGWWIALAARVIDRYPDAIIKWEENL